MTPSRSAGLIGKLLNDTVHNVHNELLNEYGEIDKLPRDYVDEKALANLKSRYAKPSSFEEFRNIHFLSYSGLKHKRLCTLKSKKSPKIMWELPSMQRAR